MKIGPPQSLRGNFIWSLGGNTVYNLAQWLLLVALARLTNTEAVGQFGLSLAIAAPVYLAVGLNLRIVIATDSGTRWRLIDYMRLRRFLNIVSMVIVIGIGIALGLRGETLLVLALVSGAKASEAASQTLYGYFQRLERMDYVSQSLLMRALTGSILFVVGLLSTNSLIFGCLGLWIGWSVVLWSVDRMHAQALRDALGGSPVKADQQWDTKAMIALGRRALPLGVDAGVSSLTFNLPRYLVAGILSTATLGVFVALAYLAQIVSMITGSLADAVVARLSVYYAQQDRGRFTRLLCMLTAFGFITAVLAVGGSALLGQTLIRLVLGTEYVNVPLLVVLMLSSGLATLQRCLGRGLQAAHRFVPFLVVDVVTVAGVALSATALVNRYGPVGAAWSLCLGFAAGCLADCAYLWQILRSMPKQLPDHDLGTVRPRFKGRHREGVRT